ncbi:MAG: hypothetical protein ACRD07_16090 [Acidimicrobiales bacterium]
MAPDQRVRATAGAGDRSARELQTVTQLGLDRSVADELLDPGQPTRWVAAGANP